ncbi:MAG: Rieske 2Fe-2S domain-containing protein [Rubrivivax sp.]
MNSPPDPQCLVQHAQVHRDLYCDPALHTLEMQRLFPRSWLFVGHDSQVPGTGDYITARLGDQQVLMLRRADGGISVLHNRCAHKGAQLLSGDSGCAGRALRCPYHGWSYRLDGSLLGVPLRADYEGSGFDDCPAQQGLTPYGEVAVHRGFVFARAETHGGTDFVSTMTPILDAIDLLADRSPEGRLRIAGGVLRTLVHANWKIYLENINDAFHPVTAHASVSQTAQAVWSAQPEGSNKPPAMQQLLPFGSGYEFFERMGARVLPHGHSVLGTQQSLHSAYAGIDGYGEALAAAHGAERAQQVLAFAPQNVVAYPTLALKGSPQVMRVLRPLAVDRTLVEAWAFEAVGAPRQLLAGALLYNRQVFSPMSVVAHDDLHLFEGVQNALPSRGNPWVSLHRGAAVEAAAPREVSGIDEALLRNQYRAWAEGMVA